VLFIIVKYGAVTKACPKHRENRWVLGLLFARETFPTFYQSKELCSLLTSQRGRQVQGAPVSLPVLIT
jgi:hypothetical protein